MKSFEMSKPISAATLNENMFKQFNVKINFEKYTREQLENARNLLRTKTSTVESSANFNDLLSNETYQRDKYMLGVLNTKIKEMLGESMLSEKSTSQKQARTMAAAAHNPKFAKKVGIKQSVAKEFNKADKGTKQLSKAMTNKKTTEAADKKPSTWTDKSGKTHSGTKVVGKNYKGDVAEKEKKAKTESLKGGQSKLDKNKNGKLDKDDFKKLRKTKVKESDVRHNLYANFINEGIHRYIAEDEEGKAKSITAAADMVNDFTGWMQRVGNYQTKSMIELADNIRANFGMQEAEQFKQAVGQALEGALQSLTSAREEINNAVAVLAGEAPGEEQMGMDPTAEPGMDDSMDALNPSADDEFAASDAAAGGSDTTGRAMREHIEKGNRLMRILGA